MDTGKSWIRECILQFRKEDKPELSDEEYIKFFSSHIVTSPSIPGIIHGFVTGSGEVIGYTSECSGNIHYVLANIYCGEETLNPQFTIEYRFNSIKIKSEKSFKIPTPAIPTEPQISSWLEILKGTGETMFNLGWGYENWFTLGQINQMDMYTLNKHLTT